VVRTNLSVVFLSFAFFTAFLRKFWRHLATKMHLKGLYILKRDRKPKPYKNRSISRDKIHVRTIHPRPNSPPASERDRKKRCENLHRHTKFHRNRMIRGRDIAIKPFSIWRPTPYWICCDLIILYPGTLYYVPSTLFNLHLDWFSTF